MRPNRLGKRADVGASMSVIIALIVLLVGLLIAYIFLKDSVRPLLESKLGSLFSNAKFG